jgi:hypothetical protein
VVVGQADHYGGITDSVEVRSISNEGPSSTGAGPTRAQLVSALADVSHRTWLRQKVRDQGARRGDLDPNVAPHDVERAEDIVRKLEELGVVRFGGV